MTKQVRQEVVPTHIIGSTGDAEGSNIGYRTIGNFKGDLGLGTSLTVTANNGGGSEGTPAFSFTGDTNTGMFNPSGNVLAFSTNGTQKMTVLENGNVGIGISSPTAKLQVQAPAGSGDVVATFRQGTNVVASIISALNLAAFGNTAGNGETRIFSNSLSGFVTFQTATIERLHITSAGVVRPGADNTQDFGAAAFRWKEIFAGTGTINTSDAREKTEVRELTADEIAAAKDLAREIGAFKFLAAIELKGEGARNHIGMTVQKAIEIMEAHDLDPFAYGFICYDEWEAKTIEHPAVEAAEATEESEAVEAQEAWTETTLEAGNRYGFRATELLLFVARGFEARLSALEADG